MNVKLELSFESLAELRTYIEQTTQSVPVIPEAAPPMPVSPFVTNANYNGTPDHGTVTAEAPTPAPAPAPEPVPAPAPMPEPAPAPEPSAAPAVTTAATQYSLDDLARAGAELVEQGKQAELPGLLNRFGITSLPDLPMERYGEFATVLREMGARI